MKTYKLVMSALTSFAAVSAMAQVKVATNANQAGTTSAWRSMEARELGPGLSVKSGQAKLDDALSILVPQPYKVLVDETIPRTVVLNWADSSDWLSALRQSVSPMGYKVIPKWDKNTIYLADAPLVSAQAVQAQASSAAQGPAAVSPTSVTATSPSSATTVVATGTASSIISASASNAADASLSAPEVKPAAKFSFTANPAEGNLRVSLNKWLRSLNYQDVAWMLPKDIPLDRAHTFEEDTLANVLRKVAKAYDDTPRAMRFCEHTNKVIRVIPITQYCKPLNTSEAQ